MFNELSNQKVLSEHFQRLSVTEKKLAGKHMLQTIGLLNTPTKELLINRRNHGVLFLIETNELPQNNNHSLNDNSYVAENGSLNKATNIERILLNSIELHLFINELCLTEAILIRDNFINVLDDFGVFHSDNLVVNSSIESDVHIESSTVVDLVSADSLPKNRQQEDMQLKEKIAKDNVSPIRLTEIKQRLSFAIIEADNQKESVRNKLNGLLKQTETKKPSNISKLAV